MAKNEEKEEYKFVIAILAGTISFLYTSFSYIQNTAINIVEYSSLCALISLALIISIVYFIYFICKGFSIELKDEYHEIFKNIASKIYLMNFLTCTLFLIIVVIIIFVNNVVSIYKGSFIIIFSIGLFILLIIFRFCDWMLDKFKFEICLDGLIRNGIKISIKQFKIIWASILICWIILFFLIGFNSHLGNIELDMDKIYYKNDEQIPIMMKITGPDTHYSIRLYKDESINLIEKWNISLGADNIKYTEITNFMSVDSLVASSLGNGNYNIFINTTNLTTGYYQIKISRHSNGKDSYESGFYLLD